MDDIGDTYGGCPVMSRLHRMKNHIKDELAMRQAHLIISIQDVWTNFYLLDGFRVLYIASLSKIVQAI
uniref:Retrotransposon protein n=1 Tax=Ascaris lumbricoides TaxID=6252 RepID=A0A0M3HG24_ASCLU